MLLCVLPSEFRSCDVAYKTGVAGAASVDSDDGSEEAPLMAALVKFAFDGPALVGRRVVNKGFKLLGGAVVGRFDFPLPDISYRTRDSADGVVVRGKSICLKVE